MLRLSGAVSGKRLPVAAARLQACSARRNFSKWVPSARIQAIRNVGICAHVDAGKTTTTERILFYSKKIRAMGDVDSGDTQMDFLEEERARGITIQSACTTFDWNAHRINLIDTPGHVDFTVEVERAVRVLDGAVTVFDAVKGVEAQSETVWKQCDRYNVPRVAFINKMDREGASLNKSVDSIKQRLRANTLLLQLPMGESSDFRGVIDLLSMQEIMYNDATGTTFSQKALSSDHPLFTAAQMARERLIEQLADVDEVMADLYLSHGPDSPLITSDILRAAVRRVTVGGQGVGVLCGTAFRNKGIQPLMDAIVDYLPSPADRGELTATINADPAIKFKSGKHAASEIVRPDEKAPLRALAFKVVHDPRVGPVVFTRVYSGVLKAKDQLVNSSNGMTKERPLRVLEINAQSQTDISTIEAGNIGALVGLKGVRTGDTLIDSQTSVPYVLPGIKIPPPVFFCSVEAASNAEQEALDQALENMVREDPSLQVSVDKDTGQTLVKGMGELHLEIVRNRLKSSFKVDADMGRMRVSYRETIASSCRLSHTFTGMIAGKPVNVSMEVELEPREEGEGINTELDLPDQQMANLPVAIKEAMLQGLQDGFSRGAVLGYPVTDTAVKIVSMNVPMDADLVPAAVRACAAQSVAKALRNEEGVGCTLLEPIMATVVEVNNDFLGHVLSDLSMRRRADIKSTESEALRSSVWADVPLSEMVGYASALRSSTQGTGSFSMALSKYGPVPAHITQKLVANPP